MTGNPLHETLRRGSALGDPYVVRKPRGPARLLEANAGRAPGDVVVSVAAYVAWVSWRFDLIESGLEALLQARMRERGFERV